MFFTLAVSAGSALQCTALTDRALATDPRVMPIPGPPSVAWRSPDGRVAFVHWGTHPGGDPPGGAPPVPSSRAGTIWVDPSDGLGAPLRARTSLTRIDPVYAAQLPEIGRAHV